MCDCKEDFTQQIPLPLSLPPSFLTQVWGVNTHGLSLVSVQIKFRNIYDFGKISCKNVSIPSITHISFLKDEHQQHILWDGKTHV